jgi:hypothetical protein
MSDQMPPPLRVGVTGHRFLAEPQKLEAGVDDALRRLSAAYPGRRLVVLSALAEGADRLVARRALRLGGGLLALLPLTLADYQQDFATAESRAEFCGLLQRAEQVIQLPPAPSRDAAYAAVGSYTLEHCHVLMALWDGQEAQGQGGTGETVLAARRLGLPVAWIHAGNRRPCTLESTTLGEEQGQVTLERLPRCR